MKAAQPKLNGNQNALKHGLTTMQNAVAKLGARAIPGNSKLGYALRKWRRELIADLGGDVSTQQSAMIDLCVKSKLMLDSIDAWLLTQPSLINKRKKSLLPVVKERQALADGLARYLAQLGLGRIAKDTDVPPWEKPITTTAENGAAQDTED